MPCKCLTLKSVGKILGVPVTPFKLPCTAKKVATSLHICSCGIHRCKAIHVQLPQPGQLWTSELRDFTIIMLWISGYSWCSIKKLLYRIDSHSPPAPKLELHTPSAHFRVHLCTSCTLFCLSTELWTTLSPASTTKYSVSRSISLHMQLQKTTLCAAPHRDV